jgi:2-hydroxy-6-oxonona-2,4-dienedioate hydrolase
MDRRAVSLSIWTELTDCDFKQRFVTAGGVRTRLLEAGEGPPLILLHGTGGHAEAYARNLAALAKRFHVIAYDMIGHGYSDKPDKPYTIDVYSEHLAHTLDAIELDRVYLSGESLGAWVAAWFAAHETDRVSRLVLNTPSNIFNRREIMEKITTSSLAAVMHPSPEKVRERLAWLFFEGNRELLTDELVDVRYRIYSRPGFQRAMENILVLQDPEVRERFAWRRDWVQKIEAPTLLLWTSHDPTGTLEETKTLAGWVSHSRVAVIEQSGHWPQWEKPTEFNQLHEEFLLGS